MISKEVITEALRMYPQYSISDKCTGNIQYKHNSNVIHFEVNSNGMSQLNTYELIHQCKESMYKLNWMVHERKTPIGTYEYSALHRGGTISPSYNDIFILFQHILDDITKPIYEYKWYIGNMYGIDAVTEQYHTEEEIEGKPFGKLEETKRVRQ